MNWEKLNWRGEKFAEIEKTKLYDLAMAVPLIIWFGWSAWQLWPILTLDAEDLLSGYWDLSILLQFLALFASATFYLLAVWLLLARSMPVKKSKGLLPRLLGFAGTFLGIGILHMKVVPLSLFWQVLADILILSGYLLCVLILARLGRAFSILPEARLLVTSGPYAYARHPLYAAETLAMIGIAIQFQQPWAGLLAIANIAVQVVRSIFEERVLAEAYPEYESYRARTKRFIPGII